mmetsp:Transcript_49477/g.127685  ORF Transcript_49477/g.127685 Transcript_49477/m.127685 type:complete len:208 (+) Transcript_49477:87-710(+)
MCHFGRTSCQGKRVGGRERGGSKRAAGHQRPSQGPLLQHASRHVDLQLVADVRATDRAVGDALLLAAERAEREVLARQADHVGQVVHADDAGGVLVLIPLLSLLGLQALLQLEVLRVERVLQHEHGTQLLVQIADLQLFTVADHEDGLRLLVQCLVLLVLLVQVLHAAIEARQLCLQDPLAVAEVLDVLPQVSVLLVACAAGGPRRG